MQTRPHSAECRGACDARTWRKLAKDGKPRVFPGWEEEAKNGSIALAETQKGAELQNFPFQTICAITLQAVWCNRVYRSTRFASFSGMRTL